MPLADAFNQKLRENRAEAVKNYPVKQGWMPAALQLRVMAKRSRSG